MINDKDIPNDSVIRTQHGKFFNAFDPDPRLIDIRDIAHALSITNRWTGHTKEPYSVARHSIFCCELLTVKQPEYALEGLLHDAAEAYLNDIARPYKKRLPSYLDLEDHLNRAIATKFNLAYPFPSIVKSIDDHALNVEYNAFHLKNEDSYSILMQHGYFDYRDNYMRFLNLFISLQRGDTIVDPIWRR